jgi:methionyl aminopeptidase
MLCSITAFNHITIMSVAIKTSQEVEKMRVAGRLTSEVLDYIGPFVKAGVTTNELDKLCHDLIVNVQHGIPAPLNYAPPGHTPYPKSICSSINHQICHGVPSEKVLKNGDIVNLDITVIKDGYHGDSSRMFFVGEPSIQAKRLWHTRRQSRRVFRRYRPCHSKFCRTIRV